MAESESRAFNRISAGTIRNKLEQNQSVLILGPRQTGKTTLLNQIFADTSWQSVGPPPLKYQFQLPSTRHRMEADPETLIREVEAHAKGQYPVKVWIDEIQLVPAVMDVLQVLIDDNKITLAATGSSARKLRKIGANWLPGRLILMHFSPLTWDESQTAPGITELDEMLLYGGLPGVMNLKSAQDKADLLASYEQLYLEEEIRMESVVRSIPRFAKFLRLAALESGTAPNLSKIGQKVELSHTTIHTYYQILEDSLIAHRIDAFGATREKVLRSPRHFFFDLGVRNATAGLGHSTGILTLQRGTLFENWVTLEVLARLRDRAKIFYWRSEKKEEVDLVIEKNGTRTLIEIKATEHPNRDDFTGLVKFKQKYDCNQGWVVCRAPRPQQFGGFTAVPWQELSALLSGL